MKKKPPIIAKDLPAEITKLEGLKVGVNVAQMAETVNCFLWTLANNHSIREIHATLKKFRGKREGFWRKQAQKFDRKADTNQNRGAIAR